MVAGLTAPIRRAIRRRSGISRVLTLTLATGITGLTVWSSSSSCHAKSDSSDVRKFSPPFKTAIIAYELYGPMIGHETVYIDWSNLRVAIVTSLTGPLPNDVGSQWWDIYTQDVHYSIDQARNEIVRAADTTAEQVLRLNYVMAQPRHPIGEDVVAGQSCQLTKAATLYTLCIGNGVVLLNACGTSDDPCLSKRAVQVQTNVPLPEDKFTPPASMRLVDASPPAPRTGQPVPARSAYCGQCQAAGTFYPGNFGGSIGGARPSSSPAAGAVRESGGR